MIQDKHTEEMISRDLTVPEKLRRLLGLTF